MNYRMVLVLIVAMLAVSVVSARQEASIKKKDVPKAVLDAFTKSYPKAAVKGYSKETENGKTLCEVASSEGKVGRDVTYGADGSLVSLEETVAFNDLPEPVRTAFQKDHPDAKGAKWEKVMEGSVTKFEAHMTVGKKSVEVSYNPDGTLLK